MRALLMALVLASCASPIDPDRIELIRGYQPESAVRGPSTTLYAGTLTGGGIERVDLVTHEVAWVVTPVERGTRVLTGLAYDAQRGQIVACGAWLGNAFVFDAATGELLSQIQLPGAGLVNAVALRGETAYFTDSLHPVLYRVARDANGRFSGDPIAVPLTGDFQSLEGMHINANGIVAPADRAEVLVVHSGRGELYRIDPTSGEARLVDVGGVDLVAGDGLLLDDEGLVIVQLAEEGRLSSFELAADLGSARRTATLTDPRLRSPTTASRDGSALWVLDSRLLEIFHGNTQPEDEFDLVRVRLAGQP
jgi:hypothetical protein